MRSLLSRLLALFSPSPTALSHAYQRGIIRRYTRESAAWQSHLASPREAILAFLERYPADRLTVLGSGWLLDLPVEELLQRGLQLTLCDVAHPPQILAQYRGNPRLTFITLDITGGLHALLGKLPRNQSAATVLLDAISRLRPPIAALDSHAPVVSLNLLSQLPYPLLERYEGILPWHIVTDAAATLQRAHLQLLHEFPTSLLITDVAEKHYESGQKPLLRTLPTVYLDLPDASCAESWVWRFDETGHYLPGLTVHLEVQLRELNRPEISQERPLHG